MIPAETQILDELELRLAGIKESNGYSVTLRDIERGKLTPFKGEDVPAVNYWPTTHSRIDAEYGLDQHTLRVMIDARAKTRDENFPDVAAKLIADIVTALNRKPSAPKVSDDEDYDFEETVSSVLMTDSGYQIGEGQKPWVGALVEVEIVYDSASGDMFNYQP